MSLATEFETFETYSETDFYDVDVDSYEYQQSVAFENMLEESLQSIYINGGIPHKEVFKILFDEIAEYRRANENV